MKLESTRGISRMNYESTKNGWLVRYTTEGVTFNKLFSDSNYGSSEASLAAAEKFFDEIRTLFPPPTWEEFIKKMGVDPESGVVGVGRRRHRHKDKYYYFWEARASLDGKEVKRRFSVAKYGEEEAKRLAIATRKAMEPLLEKQYYEKYWNYRHGSRVNRADIVQNPFAFEGAEKFVLHRAAEREPNLRILKLRAFRGEHGTLFCELCGFDFEQVYGQLGKGLIEVHHLVPISKMEENHKTTIQELICICSNCHFVVHNGDADENLPLMRALFDGVTRSQAPVEQCGGGRR